MLLQVKLQTFQNIILDDFLNLSRIQLPPIKSNQLEAQLVQKMLKMIDRLCLCLTKVRAFSTISSARVLQGHNRYQRYQFTSEAIPIANS